MGCHSITTLSLRPDDVAYIVDALINAAEERRAREGRIHERIADHLEDLALTFHDTRPDVLEVTP